MDVATGDRLLEQGNIPAALEAYQTALGAVAARFETTHDAMLMIETSIIATKMGDVYSQQGNFPAAIDIYEKSLVALGGAERAFDAPQNPPVAGPLYTMFSNTHRSVGEILDAQGNRAAAIERYRTALGFAERSATTNSVNPATRSELALCYLKLAEAHLAQGDSGAALDSYRRCLAILDRADADGSPAAKLSSHVLLEIAAIEASQGQPVLALATFERARQLLAALAAAGDDESVGYGQNLALCHERIGDLKRQQGDRQSAFESYKTAGLLLEQIAERADDPAPYHRIAHVVLNKMGDLLRESDQLPGALRHYSAASTLMSAIAATDIGNTAWQRDLWQTHNRMGDALIAQGQPEAALASYERAHVIFKRLALSDPDNAAWQRDLLASYVKLGDLLLQLARQADASAMFHAGRELAGELLATSPDHELWPRYVAFFDEVLARPGFHAS